MSALPSRMAAMRRLRALIRLSQRDANGGCQGVIGGGSVAGIFVNVMAFGATGNGVTDDTAAIQAAFRAGAGGTVFFPDGDYLVHSPMPALFKHQSSRKWWRHDAGVINLG